MPEPGSLSLTLAGQPSSVLQARRAVRGFLGDTSRTEDAELIVSELATNAVLHSASRQQGGEFELRLDAKPGWLRIEVIDQGPLPTSTGISRKSIDHYRESGRGLLIVDALADEWAFAQEPGSARYWAELWTDKEPRS